MTTLLPSYNLGFVKLRDGSDEFSGTVSITLSHGTLEWWVDGFRGIFSEDGFPYRGRWVEGEDGFSRLKSMFMSDSRMPELASEIIKKVTRYG